METTAPSAIPAVPERLDEKTLETYRRLGFLQADLDPMHRLAPETVPLFDGADPATAEWARRRYCGTIGVELLHIHDPERRAWLQQRMESEPGPGDQGRIFDHLLRADTFEQMLQQRYLGTKRFSIEGVDALIPLLDEMLEACADHRTRQVVLAMSHRGRLNVMTHTVGKPAAEIFAGFEDVDPRSILGGGDVKYHMGATGEHRGKNGHAVSIHLVSNPSHLEAVDPVAVGRVRAKQARIGDADRTRVVPIVLHGDAAFAGQGVLAETLNFAEVPAYDVGGTIQVIVNNLIGFTTEPKNLHSTRFASDVARRLPIPIFHVNAEDPDAVARVARIAVDYRQTFHSDVVVDLIGYRRHGHSEVDDPTITQPLLYKKIAAHPPAWRLYGRQIGLSEDEMERRLAAVRAEFDIAHQEAGKIVKKPTLRTLPAYWDRFRGGDWDADHDVTTGLSADRIAALTAPLTAWPEGFHVHEKIKKLLEQRAEMGQGKRPFDYGMAEAVAFASLLSAGVPIRFTGQDVRRGTFNQRHAVLIDVENGAEHVPLAQVAAAGDAWVEICESTLSEAAVLGFEYGFSRDFPEALVLWEAQFGDFANGAQIIIDQFITAGEDKWGLLSGVVLLLPHGYEGQGPEHSSARVERYLQLCGEDNIQVAQPSTAAQYFHLLRRQVLRPWRKPLVVFTPKSMLRHKDSSSTVEELGRAQFQNVIGDPQVSGAQRVLLCTGKIGHELRRERDKRKDTTTAVVFVEQLYPFPEKELEAELARHAARDVVWVQEEPANMGALFFVQPRIERLLRRPIRSIKRAASGSPATGSAKAHNLEQQALLTLAFTTGG
ncbi:MAG TPA: 2-oxoglutarate dehydrogenase E1 component [Acidobacteria bacterium]|nr:2-oxoglutarate dehydrogenase E1 component [Acidobacteriota bacterium]